MTRTNPFATIEPNYPKAGTLPYKLARYLTAYSPRCEGVVPVQEFFNNNDHITHKQILNALRYLRKKFGYYCVMRNEMITCADKWPEQRLSSDFKETKKFGPQWVPIPDPRLNSVPIKTKFPTPDKANGPVLAEIATYIIRHRDPNSHVVDADYLYRRFGTKRVLNKFDVLNNKYGYRVVSMGHKLWHVTRIPNRKP